MFQKKEGDIIESNKKNFGDSYFSIRLENFFFSKKKIILDISYNEFLFFNNLYLALINIFVNNVQNKNYKLNIHEKKIFNLILKKKKIL